MGHRPRNPPSDGPGTLLYSICSVSEYKGNQKGMLSILRSGSEVNMFLFGVSVASEMTGLIASYLSALGGYGVKLLLS